MSTAELLDVGPGGEQITMSPSMGVAMIALNFAMKFHDINTVQDGTLYQQYKLEGKNMSPLHLDMVFETARRIELHLVTSAGSIQQMLVDGVMSALENAVDAEPEDQSACEASDAAQVPRGSSRDEVKPYEAEVGERQP